MKTQVLMTLATLTFAVSAHAASQNVYDCSYVSGDDPGASSTTLTVNSKDAAVVQDGTDAKGEINEDYKPHTGDENYVEYTGFDALNGDGYQVELLAAKQLLKGAKKGTMKIRARGEGYFNTVYSCVRQ
jgi:hypothetical protein